MSIFDDERVDDPAALEAADHLLRRLAMAGARVRAELEASEDVLAGLESDGFRPRAGGAGGAGGGPGPRPAATPGWSGLCWSRSARSRSLPGLVRDCPDGPVR